MAKGKGDDGPLVQYVTPDPDFPLPAGLTDTGVGSECSDEHQLERWRVNSEVLRTRWFGDCPMLDAGAVE